MRRKRKNRFLHAAACFFLLIAAGGTGLAQNGPGKTPELEEPVQITAETEPVSSMDVSGDGRKIVYITGGRNESALWKASADPADFELPQKLLPGDSAKHAAAISPAGDRAAYVDTRFDAQGDIYVMDTANPDKQPLRLTGRNTADGGPAFSPDGESLYFHRQAKNGSLQLAVLDPSSPEASAKSLDTKGDGMLPAVSPDGETIAFISGRDNPSGDIFCLNLKTGAIRQLTSGPAIDRHPAWGKDGKTLYFSRIAADTNQDGDVSEHDNAVICRLHLDRPEEPAYPLTSLRHSAVRPVQVKDRLFYLSDRADTMNCWSIAESGPVPAAKDADTRIRLARKLEESVPAAPYLSLLAWYRVMELHPEERAAAARAGLAAGRIYEEQNLMAAARAAYKDTAERLPSVVPHGPAAKIRHTEISARIDIEKSPLEEKRRKLYQEAISAIDAAAEKASDAPAVRSEAGLARARLAIKSGFAPGAIGTVSGWLDSVSGSEKAPDAHKAEALFYKARLHEQAGLSQSAQTGFRRLLKKFPEARPWARKAADHLLDAALSGLPGEQTELKINKLQRLAEKNRDKLPVLSLAATNRTGDIHYAKGNRERAKAAYRTVIEQSPGKTVQAAAARFSLAEILYEEERFRKALDLYEEEIHLRPAASRIYQLARQGYINKTLSAGEFHYRLGEIDAAKNTFRELIDYDSSIIPAHRGYIKCRAAAGDTEKTIARYKKKLEKHPDNPLWLYTTGLAISYRDSEAALETAAGHIKKAVRIKGHVPWFHQSLGYINEALESVYDHDNRLEHALSSYKRAYFLIDPGTNARDAADLELNLGNTYYLLGQHGKALEFYTRRLERETAFADPRREIVFYKRLGESAFQAMDAEQARTAYKKALEKIEKRIAPRASAKAFDRLHRVVRDRILAPAVKLPELEKRAEKLAEKQAGISSQVAACAESARAPPGEKWSRYKKEITRLTDEQKKLNEKAAELARDVNRACDSGECRAYMDNPAEILRLLTQKIREDLLLPEDLVSLQTELTDRLGLACQETGRHREAAEAFETVFQLNKKRGKTGNLAANRRAAACNTYYLAQDATGDKRRRLLEKAAADFREVIALVDRYGVASREKKEKEGLFAISLQTSMDEGSATRAAHGFSRVQEKRLARAFLSRIALETGDLQTARENLQPQLAQYPISASVAEKDRYGVALLYHRAGLVAHAEKEYERAWERFVYSAELCLQMQAPASAAANMDNLAAVLEERLCEGAYKEALKKKLRRFSRLDTKVCRLMEKTPGMQGSLRLADYHNAMAVCYALAAEKIPAEDAETAVFRMHRLSRAAGHLTSGLRLLSGSDPAPARKALETKARLHLNLAAVSDKTGDSARMREQFEKALAVAEQGLLPDMRWRALAGLGKLRQALDALSSVTPARAGCRPQEITRTFGPLVLDEYRRNGAESAFSLAEKIGELERFNRTAFLIRPATRAGKNFYKKRYPRLSRIQSMRRELEAAPEEKASFVKKRLERELSLFRENSKSLPDPVAQIAHPEKRRQAILALGAMVRAEEAAAAAVREKNRNQPDKETVQSHKKRYRELTRSYHEAAQETGPASGMQAGGIRALLSPVHAVAPDVTQALDKNERLRRIFPTGRNDPAYLVFTLSRDAVSARPAKSLRAVRRIISGDSEDLPPYVAYEAPAALDLQKPVPFLLSGTHLYRAYTARKPFKHRLMAVSESFTPGAREGAYEVLEAKDALKSGDFAARDLAAVDTMVFPHRLTATNRVPTRTQQPARPFIAAYTAESARTELAGILSRAQSLSLAVCADMDTRELDRIIPLFSIYGCPSVAVLSPQEGEKEQAIDRLMSAYSRKSAFEAAAGLNKDSRLLFLGYRGMGPQEAKQFGKERFSTYVKTGRQAFDEGRNQTALVHFSNAAEIAEEMEAFSRYLPGIYRYARESAYKAANLEKALTFAQKLASVLEKRQPDSTAHAEAMLTLGLIHARRSQYKKAVPVIEEAVEMYSLLEADEKLASAMTELGIVLENATRYESALARFRKAADLTEQMLRSQMLAAQHINIGRIYDLRMNRYPRAIKHYEKALALYEKAGDPEKTAESRLNIGRCYRLLGIFPKAKDFYESALDELKAGKQQNPRMRGKILMEQANNAWFQGDFESAFRIQRKALKLAEENNLALLRVMAKNTSGLIWWSLGDYEKALRELETALDTARSLSIRQDEVASTLNNIGLVHRDNGDYEKALETFDKALAIDEEIDSRWALAYDFRNKALTRLQMGQPEKALPLFDRALFLANAIGNKINAAKALLGKANALLETGEADSAEAAFSEALELSRDMEIKETRWRALYGLGRVSREFADEPQAAEDYLREALKIIESMRAAIQIRALKENFMANRLTAYEYLVGLLADRGKPVAALETAERSRGRNFIDLLGTQRISLKNAAQEELYNRHTLLRSEIEATEKLLAAAETKTEKAAYQKDLEELRNRLDSLMTDIQAEHPGLSALVSIPPVSAEEISKNLEPGVALLSYYVLDSEVLCWVIRHEGADTPVELFRMPADSKGLGDRVREYRRIIQNLQPWENHAKALYKDLLAPVRGELEGIHTVGVIPHGPLHYLSWATLYDGENFFLDKFSLFYLPSASVLDYTTARRIKRPKLSLEVLAIGNPELEQPGLELAFAEPEVNSIKWNFPEITILTGEKATESWLVDNISRFDIIHIASHGEFDPVNPLMSAIKLSRAEDAARPEDGDLRAAEVFGLDVNADMVCMSACQTGLGKVTTGDEIIGLNRSFFYAGTHTVLSTLWRVSDVSTAMLTKTFYRRYTRENKADSLRDAALHVRRFYPHPGYWGAFTLVGDFK
ncbi:MAG: CHAT domain-containing protein [Desulfosalsimonadaceae bacterium]